MITKKEFINLIEEYKNWEENFDQLDNAFGKHVDLCESFIYTYPNTLLDLILKAYFNKEGIDWIYWWLFERPYNPPEAFDENNNPMPTKTIKDLWNIVKSYTI